MSANSTSDRPRDRKSVIVAEVTLREIELDIILVVNSPDGMRIVSVLNAYNRYRTEREYDGVSGRCLKEIRPKTTCA